MTSAKPPAARVVPIETIQVEVTRGHSVQCGDKVYRPGEIVPLPVADFAHLVATGFVIDPNAEPPPQPIVYRGEIPDGGNPANVGLQQHRAERPGFSDRDPS
jgi:hypothetical protein